MWIAAFLQGISRFALSGVLADTLGLLVEAWGQSARLDIGVATVTGMLMAGRSLFGVAAAPLAGATSDWVGSRWRVAAWALVIGTTGMALMTSGAPAAILAGVSLCAVTRGSMPTIATSLSGDIVSPGQQGRAIGLLHTAGDLGSAIGPPAAYALLPWIGLRGLYPICAGLFVVGLILVLWGQPCGQQVILDAA